MWCFGVSEGASDRRRRTPFQIPHSLVLLPDRRELCVADRENGRIQCFLAESGEFVKEIKREEFGGKVFAITYSPVGGELPGDPHTSSPPGPPALVQFWSCSGPVRGTCSCWSYSKLMGTLKESSRAH